MKILKDLKFLTSPLYVKRKKREYESALLKEGVSQEILTSYYLAVDYWQKMPVFFNIKSPFIPYFHGEEYDLYFLNPFLVCDTLRNKHNFSMREAFEYYNDLSGYICNRNFHVNQSPGWEESMERIFGYNIYGINSKKNNFYIYYVKNKFLKHKNPVLHSQNKIVFQHLLEHTNNQGFQKYRNYQNNYFLYRDFIEISDLVVEDMLIFNQLKELNEKTSNLPYRKIKKQKL